MQVCLVFGEVNKTCSLSSSVIDKRAPVLFTWSMLGRVFFPRGSWSEFFLIRESWLQIIRFFHVRVKYFFYLNVTRVWRTELNVTREPFCFAWWIPSFLIVLKMNYSRTVVVKFWPGFGQDMSFIWINKSHKTDL